MLESHPLLLSKHAFLRQSVVGGAHPEGSQLPREAHKKRPSVVFEVPIPKPSLAAGYN